jgi:hypothetical protein
MEASDSSEPFMGIDKDYTVLHPRKYLNTVRTSDLTCTTVLKCVNNKLSFAYSIYTPLAFY